MRVHVCLARISGLIDASDGLFLCDELHTGSINGANAGDLPCGLRRFKRDDLKSRFAAQSIRSHSQI